MLRRNQNAGDEIWQFFEGSLNRSDVQKRIVERQFSYEMALVQALKVWITEYALISLMSWLKLRTTSSIDCCSNETIAAIVTYGSVLNSSWAGSESLDCLNSLSLGIKHTYFC